jgi:hypothetical protein
MTWMPLTRRVRPSDETAERRSVPLHGDRVPIDDLGGSGEACPAVTRLVHGPWERLLRTSAHPPCQCGYVVSATAPRRTAPGCRRVWEAGDGARGSPARRPGVRLIPRNATATISWRVCRSARPPGQCLYFEEEPGTALGGQVAHQGRGPPHGGELREAAEPVARESRARRAWRIAKGRNPKRGEARYAWGPRHASETDERRRTCLAQESEHATARHSTAPRH